MDISDMATAREEHHRAISLDAQARAAQSVLVPRGSCLYCDDPLPPGRLFCEGVDCRDDFEKLQQAKRRNGS